jgi:diphthamide biosynthesis protein 2
MPVVVVPYRRTFPDVEAVVTQLCAQIPYSDQDKLPEVLLLYDPSYHLAVQGLVHELEMSGMSSSKPVPHITVGGLPDCANIYDTGSSNSSKATGVDAAALNDIECEIIGGLLAPKKLLLENDALHIWYIGDKDTQIVNILLRVSSSVVTIYSPAMKTISLVEGQTKREYAARYGGISRVKNASIVGLIVGSMGLTGEATNALVSRLRRLLTAARKRCYVLVMGRLNDAKLCNFPEIDIFCLISNEDTAVVPAKTFFAPVLTPYELEIGLGARDWTGYYINSTTTLMQDSGATESGLQAMEERVRDTFPPEEDDEDEAKDLTGQSTSYAQEEEDEEEEKEGDEQGDATAIVESEQQKEKAQQIAKRQDDRMTIFNSPALEFFQQRTFQGLEFSAEEGASTKVQQGQFGTASGYQRQTLSGEEQGATPTDESSV